MTKQDNDNESNPAGALLEGYKPKQPQIPGTEDPDRDDDLDAHAAAWIECEEEVRTAKSELDGARSRATARMIEKGYAKYRYVDGEVVKILTSETVGVVKMRNPKRDEGDE